MPPAPPLHALQCLRCRAVYDDQRLFTGCPRCARESVNVNLSVALDPAPLGPLTPASFPAAPRSLWRFRQLLPLGDAEPVSLGEGATPLVHLERLGRRLGLPRLYAKDESQNPTWSYKDRLCSLAVTHAVATGAQVITISSTGNHGASTAAAAVADYRVADGPAGGKIGKDRDEWAIGLEATTDILCDVAAHHQGQFLVGFAAEYGLEGLGRAREKMERKKLDMIVFNDISRTDIGFDSDFNEVRILTPDSEVLVERAPKETIAELILDNIAQAVRGRQGESPLPA